MVSTFTKTQRTNVDRFPSHARIGRACVTYQTTRPFIRRHDFTRNQSNTPLKNRGRCFQLCPYMVLLVYWTDEKHGEWNDSWKLFLKEFAKIKTQKESLKRDVQYKMINTLLVWQLICHEMVMQFWAFFDIWKRKTNLDRPTQAKIQVKGQSNIYFF